MRPSAASCLFSFPGGNDGDGGGSHVISGVTLRRLLVLLVFSGVGGGDFAEDSWSGLLPVALLLCWLRKFWYCYGSVGRRRQDDEDSQSTFAAGSFVGLGGFPVSGGGGTSRFAFPLSGRRVGVFCVPGGALRFRSSAVLSMAADSCSSSSIRVAMADGRSVFKKRAGGGSGRRVLQQIHELESCAEEEGGLFLAPVFLAGGQLSEAGLDGGLCCNFQFFQGVFCKTPGMYCAILLIYSPFRKKKYIFSLEIELY